MVAGEERGLHSYIVGPGVVALVTFFGLCRSSAEFRVGTDGGGLNRVMPQLFEVLNPSQALTVQSVSEDANGGIWFSINNGGVSYWNQGKLKEFGEKRDWKTSMCDPYLSMLRKRCGRVPAAEGCFKCKTGGSFPCKTGPRRTPMSRPFIRPRMA